METLTEEHEDLLCRYGLYINNDKRWLYQVRDARKGNNQTHGQGKYTKVIMDRLIREVWEFERGFLEDDHIPCPPVEDAVNICQGPNRDFQPIFDNCYSEEE